MKEIDKVLNGMILVQEDEPENSMLKVKNYKPTSGVVEKLPEDDIHLKVELGDHILFKKNSGVKHGEKRIIFHDDIIAILK